MRYGKQKQNKHCNTAALIAISDHPLATLIDWWLLFTGQSSKRQRVHTGVEGLNSNLRPVKSGQCYQRQAATVTFLVLKLCCLGTMTGKWTTQTRHTLGVIQP